MPSTGGGGVFLQAIEPPSQLAAVRRSTVSSFSIDLTHKRRCNSLHLTGDLFVIFIYLSEKLQAAEAPQFPPRGHRESATYKGSLPWISFFFSWAGCVISAHSLHCKVWRRLVGGQCRRCFLLSRGRHSSADLRTVGQLSVNSSFSSKS